MARKDRVKSYTKGTNNKPSTSNNPVVVGDNRKIRHKPSPVKIP